MTMPNERTYAVCRAKDFLRRLASPYAGGIKGVKREIREEARRILRHYPHWFDLGRADAFDEAAAMRYGEQETGEDWLREIAPGGNGPSKAAGVIPNGKPDAGRS